VLGAAAIVAAVVALAAPPKAAVLVAAGDIASCSSTGDEATAALVARFPGTVATLGDTVYDRGTPDEFARCYAPSWGRFRARTRPTPGNHDYETPGAAGYFGYFRRAAGAPDRGYYSYELGAWHVVVLNSNCAAIGGCEAGSAQERWLRADLAAHPARCTLAYWHHPLFSSGPHGSRQAVAPLWQALQDAGAEAVLVGHDHLYERFAPQDAAGTPNRARGIREFVVGTGGARHYELARVAPNSVARRTHAFGVLKLTLRPARYDFRFLPVGGGPGDAGSARCR
jgi:3',5'-cyclic AMP phosphodiesterase CpdA